MVSCFEYVKTYLYILTENKALFAYCDIPRFEMLFASVHFVVFDLRPEILVNFARFHYLSKPVVAPYFMRLYGKLLAVAVNDT